ncbi:MAG: hypothetical protein HY791_13095 [Deltaproteobacteria bacterium]|nr:hypothetical protein [Deltaproteobacteria bacterium]
MTGRSVWFLVAARVGTAWVVAGACAPSADDWPAGRPRLDALEYLQQTPGDPSGLEFHFAFVDDDGDLGAGKVVLIVDGDVKADLPMAGVFGAQSPAIDSNATSGEVDIVVHLDSAAEAGQEFEIGFELEDGAGQRSNRPTVTLVAEAL